MQYIVTWTRKNLFSSWYNTIASLLAIYCMYKIFVPIFIWAIWDANFAGTGPEACTKNGACWVFVKMRFNQFMYGFYPRDLQWRINLSYIIGIINIILFLILPTKYKKWPGIFFLCFFPIIAFNLYYGGIFGLEIVEPYSWGGLHLTLIVAYCGMLFSLPLGILLALGRRSTLPILRLFCIAFIELWRAVPLISVLFMASVLIPLFFSEGVHFNKLLRALIGIALFASAYIAEVIRGGLQAIPRDQYEAAQALGFQYWSTNILIILPQALKISIPGIVNVFIALFKDTTLVLIIGLFDLLGMVQAANSDPKWLPYATEGYTFAALCFWMFCFGISRYSINLENKLDTGNKHE